MEQHSANYYRVRTSVRCLFGLTAIFAGFVLPHIIIARAMEYVGM